MLGWHDDRPLAEIFEAKDAKKIASALRAHTVSDLLSHYPRNYSVNGAQVPLEIMAAGEQVTVVAEVLDVERSISRNGMTITKITLHDGNSQLTATFFRVKFIAAALAPGTHAMFTGKLGFYREEPQLQHPQYVILRLPDGQAPKRLSATHSSLEEKLAHRDYIPIYPATRTLTSWQIFDYIDTLLAKLPPIVEPLDKPPVDLPSMDAAIRGIHAPGPEGPEPHRDRLKYNEAIELSLVMALRLDDTKHRRALPSPAKKDGLGAQLLTQLPYELTAGQKQVIAEISADLAQKAPMSRLLQGEVGSGKTVVAVAAMLQVIDNGHQCAFLAPTEVLAGQHYISLTALLAKLPLKVVLLTGSQNREERNSALLDIISGTADIVVGTHAIFQNSVEFFRLGLAIIDEQHRFGVEQRDRLRMKGEGTPHLLVMTATPIPRTIAITAFGDLTVSSLRELPRGRQKIASFVVPEYRPGWAQRTWQRLAEEISAGRQAYVVCPAIEGDGGVKQVHSWLAETLFPKLRVEILHGKMRPAEKESVMRAFSAGDIDILVATTVIEVGVDVPNASVMVIREADHFGISQLHQLRGRVGRGEHGSICFFMTNSVQELALERLHIVAATTSGFELAEADVEFRREGDILGAAQSGRSRLALLNLRRDIPLIERANQDAKALVSRNRKLAEALVVDIAPDDQAFLDKS
ncbi:ATP-dependent DNA helicase RecG [Corynebacterium caspium]|uniref:ATP-dependent DNA helicase RecG n=1 Tax=Corynebacterium caspium TaxID=234828 RepID=UPI0003805221|nr:ATP-dependent DNA helicase RecG [Corynebacterium caspium]WKD59394.1 ATP-dependent DNA helicase RecG [Corynebacterium caspium DSM 44850]